MPFAFLKKGGGKKPTNAEIEAKEEQEHPEIKIISTAAYNPADPFGPPTEIIEYLFLGSEKNAHTLSLMTEKRIGYILNVAEEARMANHDGITHTKILVEDMVTTHQHDTFEQTFQLIDKAIAENKGILVHCARGRSRSATVVIGYLMTRQKITLREAYSHVKSKRPIIGPHHSLQEQLLVFEKTLSGNVTMELKDFYAAGNKYSPYG